MAPPHSYAREFMLGGSSASMACLLTNPLEVVKTRLQLQGELARRGTYVTHYRNFFHAFYTIARHDGLWRLQAGLVPGLWYQFFMNGARLGSYQYFVNCNFLHITDADGHRHMSYPRSIFFGAVSGALGAFIGSPMYMVKTHLQSQGSKNIAVGYQHKHEGMVDALRKIFSTHGVTGLWRGWQAQIIRVIMGSSSQLSTFSMCKEFLTRFESMPSTSFTNTLLASTMGGVVVTLIMSPFDVLSTRIYNQPTDAHGHGKYYKGVGDAIYKIVKTEGPLALYKGATAVFLRVGPHTVLSLVFWDFTRKLYFKTVYPDSDSVSTA